MTVTVVLPDRTQEPDIVVEFLEDDKAWAAPNALNPRQLLPIFVGDSTIYLLGQNDGFNVRLAQLAADGGVLEGLPGWVNMGGSGYTLYDFVNDDASDSWRGPIEGDPDWDFQGKKSGVYNVYQTPMANLIEFLEGLALDVIPNVCLSIGPNDFLLRNYNGNLNAADRLAYMKTLLRTAVEAIHTACPAALIFIITPHLLLPRPYVGTVPSSSQYPSFGSDLSADTTLMTGWNETLEQSHREVAAEYRYVSVWDWRRVAGNPDISTTTPSNYPYYVDNVHEHYNGANWLADDYAQIIRGEINDPVIGRGKLADALAALDDTEPCTHYARYFELHPERYKRVICDNLVEIGAAYIDTGVPYSGEGGFLSSVKGQTPLFVQVGSLSATRLESYTAGALGPAETGNTRLYSITVPDAMQDASVGSQVSMYLQASTSSGDAYIDTVAFDYSTNSAAYLGTIALGLSGGFDLAFDTDAGREWHTECLTGVGRMSGLNIAVGGGIDTTVSLTNGDGRLPTAHQLRILLAGTYTSWTGMRAAVLVPRGQIDPGAWASDFRHPVGQSNLATVDPELWDSNVLSEVIYVGGAVTVRLPSNATKAFGIGARLGFMCNTAQVVTIAAGSGATMTTPPGKSGVMTGIGAIVWAYKRGTNTWAISGDLV